MTNGGPERPFQSGFEPMEVRWGSIHHRFSTFMSKVLLSTVPSLFFASWFSWG